jgi:hypothetical protein
MSDGPRGDISNELIGAYLTRIGMEGQAGDVAWLRGAERIIIAERDAVAAYLRSIGQDEAADAVLQGEHWR